MKTTSKISQFFCYDYFENLLAPITFANIFGSLAVVVSKIFAIEDALQSKNQLLRNALEKVIYYFTLAKQLRTKTRSQNRIHVLCKFCDFAKKYILQFFCYGKQPQNVLCLIFSGKLKFLRASRHLISLADGQAVKKVNFEPCLYCL